MVTRPLAMVNNTPPPYLDQHKVDKFIDLLKRGTRLTPIAVYVDGDRLSISHGFNRFKHTVPWVAQRLMSTSCQGRGTAGGEIEKPVASA
jgi:hypothetical protein